MSTLTSPARLGVAWPPHVALRSCLMTAEAITFPSVNVAAPMPATVAPDGVTATATVSAVQALREHVALVGG